MSNQQEQQLSGGAEGSAMPDAVAALIASIAGGAENERAFPRGTAFNAVRHRIKEAAKNAKPGDMIEEAGIFLGVYTPVDRDGNSLGKTFNVFAAPEDLPGEAKSFSSKHNTAPSFNYDEAQTRLSQLKKWHGYDGTPYATDRKLIEALRGDTYKGGWIMPPLELLAGIDKNVDPVEQPNLLALKGEGTLKDSFNVDKYGSISCSSWYWSCTETNSGSGLWCASLRNGTLQTNPADFVYINCRPVRLEPV